MANNKHQGDERSTRGTYRSLIDHGVCRNQPRRMFLEAMRRIDPDVVRSLYAQLSQPFMKVLRRHGLSPVKFNCLAGTPGMPPPLPEIWSDLYQPVIAWGLGKGICTRDDPKRNPTWSLDAGEFPFADWLVQVAGDTLGAGIAQGSAPDSWNLDHVKGACRVRTPAPAPFNFTFGAWGVLTEAWNTYAEKLRTAFDAELDRYRQAASQQPGLESTVWGKELHFDWLVKYQVHGMTWAAIARGESAPVPLTEPRAEQKISNFRTVRDAVNATAGWVTGPVSKRWLRKPLSGNPVQRARNGANRDQR